MREPEGNGVAERFIRTLKENLLWVRTFDTIEELRAALVEFARRYFLPSTIAPRCLRPVPRSRPAGLNRLTRARSHIHFDRTVVAL